VTPERRPSRRSSIQQIVLSDPRWSAVEVPADFRKDRAQQIEPFVEASFLLLVVRHRALPVKRPEADLGVNLERPVLAIWRHCVVHLLDFGAEVPWSLIALSGAVEQSNRDIDAEASKFRLAFSQSCRQIDYFD
jgi:hypothetical protein